MNAFVQLSSEERSLYCRQAVERMQLPLPAAVIEKDFWVCWILNLLNEIPELKEYLNPNEFTLKPIQKGNEVNIEFEYPGSLKNELGGLLPVVLIELVPRADEHPNEERKITSIIFEVFPDLLGKSSFQVLTLAPERTFLEKLLFIHETLEGFNKGSERKSRHYYDLFKLYKAGVFERIKTNHELLKKVIEHRKTFFKYNTLDYDGILSGGVRVVPPQERWAAPKGLISNDLGRDLIDLIGY